jgi:fatty-acid peroxygenase
MAVTRTPLVDDTLPLAVEGYGWLPNRRRRDPAAAAVHTRLLGRRTVGLCGPEAARFFYDEDHVCRRSALPEPVRGTLFGKGAVHGLDGAAHRHRKAMFGYLMDPDGIARSRRNAADCWDETVSAWAPGEPVVLFDEASRIITRAVYHWAAYHWPVPTSTLRPAI